MPASCPVSWGMRPWWAEAQAFAGQSPGHDPGWRGGPRGVTQIPPPPPMPASWTMCLPGALGRASSVKCPGLRRTSVVVGGLPDVGSQAKCGEQTPGPGSRCGRGLGCHPRPLALAVLGTRSAAGFRNGDRKAPNGISAVLHPLLPCPPAHPRGIGPPFRSDHPWARGRGQGGGWAFFSMTWTPTMLQVSKHSWVGLAGF